MFCSLRVSLLAAAAACLAVPATALAGTYTVDQATSADIAGWSYSGAAGFTGCTYKSGSGVCTGIAQPRALTVAGSGDTVLGAVGLWTFTAPDTTTVVSGSVNVSWGIKSQYAEAFLKTRTRSQDFESQPRQHEVRGTGSGTWGIAPGTQVLAVGLRSNAKVSYGSGLSNLARITGLHLTLEDDTAPTAAVTGALAQDGWLSGQTPVCATVSAADAGSGVAALALRDAAGHTLDSYSVSRQLSIQPGAPQVSHALCVVPASLSEGIQTLHATATDAAGEQVSVDVPVKVDTIAPQASREAPAGSTSNKRPDVSFVLDGGPSGLAQARADLDGIAMQQSGGTFSLTPAADLAIGVHTIHWSATDGAGNAASGQWTFTVAAAAPKALTLSAPGLLDRGTRGTLHVVLSGNAADLAGIVLDIERRALPGGRFVSAGSTRTRADGTADIRVAPASTTVYRITPRAYPGLQKQATVRVRQRLRLAASAHVLRLGRSVRLRPWVNARHDAFAVRLQLRQSGAWRTVGTARVGTALKLRPLRRGRYVFRALAAGSQATPVSGTPTVTVIVG